MLCIYYNKNKVGSSLAVASICQYKKTATPPKDEATPPVEKSQIPSASNIATQPSISPKDEQLLFDIFKYAAWGQNEPSNYAQIEAIFAEITRQGEQKPDLLLEAQKKT
jgi:hypothetical protein